jgi:hypothetical protein
LGLVELESVRVVGVKQRYQERSNRDPRKNVYAWERETQNLECCGKKNEQPGLLANSSHRGRIANWGLQVGYCARSEGISLLETINLKTQRARRRAAEDAEKNP